MKTVWSSWENLWHWQQIVAYKPYSRPQCHWTYLYWYELLLLASLFNIELLFLKLLSENYISRYKSFSLNNSAEFSKINRKTFFSFGHKSQPLRYFGKSFAFAVLFHWGYTHQYNVFWWHKRKSVFKLIQSLKWHP